MNAIVVIPTSSITCPQCQAVHTALVMPVDYCQFFWDCPSCKAVLKPLSGDCCVYCSYGTHDCPPVQEAGGKACCT